MSSGLGVGSTGAKSVGLTTGRSKTGGEMNVEIRLTSVGLDGFDDAKVESWGTILGDGRREALFSGISGSAVMTGRRGVDARCKGSVASLD